MKKQMTKQNIYTIGLELFRQKDYESVTVDDICREIHITKPTFYHHCPSKEDILAKAYMVKFSDIASGWDECPDGDYIAGIIRGMDVLMTRVFELEPNLLRAFMRAKLKHPQVEAILDPEWISQMNIIIKKALDAGQIPIRASILEVFQTLTTFAVGYSFYHCTESGSHSSASQFHDHLYSLLALDEMRDGYLLNNTSPLEDPMSMTSWQTAKTEWDTPDSRRTQIIQVGYELILNKGFENVSVNEICARIGITKPTFYRYVPSKEDILAYVFESIQKPIVAHCWKLMDEGQWLEALLYGLTATQRLALEQGLEVYSSYLQYLCNGEHASYRFSRPLVAMMTQVISHLQQEGIIANMANPETLYELLVHLDVGIVLYWCMVKGEADVEIPYRRRICNLLGLHFNDLIAVHLESLETASV